MLLGAVSSAQPGAASHTPVNPPQVRFEDALAHPDDQATLGSVLFLYRETRDENAVAMIKQIFKAAREKSSKQQLALFLLRLGQKEDVYYDELFRYAKEAITAKAPLWYFSDPQGNAIRGEYPLEFRNWCVARMLTIEDCVARVSGYATDVIYLAAAKDRRSIPLFREGLESDNEGIVSVCISALGRLNDTESLGLIDAALKRLKPNLRSIAASSLAEFDSPLVMPMLDRYITDPKARQEASQRIQTRVGIKEK
jgi:hypothetical protein